MFFCFVRVFLINSCSSCIRVAAYVCILNDRTMICACCISKTRSWGTNNKWVATVYYTQYVLVGKLTNKIKSTEKSKFGTISVGTYELIYFMLVSGYSTGIVIFYFLLAHTVPLIGTQQVHHIEQKSVFFTGSLNCLHLYCMYHEGGFQNVFVKENMVEKIDKPLNIHFFHYLQYCLLVFREKNCCIGVTRPIIKFARTLNFFLCVCGKKGKIWREKKKIKISEKSQSWCSTILL